MTVAEQSAVYGRAPCEVRFSWEMGHFWTKRAAENMRNLITSEKFFGRTRFSEVGFFGDKFGAAVRREGGADRFAWMRWDPVDAPQLPRYTVDILGVRD